MTATVEEELEGLFAVARAQTPFATVSSLASLYGANRKLLPHANAPRGVLARLIVDMMARLNPQFAFLDIRMPGMRGLEVAAACGRHPHRVRHGP